MRTDLPRYRVYRHGELVDEPLSIESYWTDDLVGFLLGCSFTFEHVMIEAGMRLRHLECGCMVPMYRTSMQCRPAGVFHGPMVVSMRPIPGGEVAKAVQISARFPAVHGAPVQVGAPEAIGIADLASPDWGDPVPDVPGRGPGVLGLRRDASGGGDGSQTAADDHPRARAHVRHRYPDPVARRLLTGRQARSRRSWRRETQFSLRYAHFPGGPPGIRTLNQWIKSPLLCR